MTTITRAPLVFWACGGDVLMRVPGAAPVVLSDGQSWDLLDHFEALRRAAELAGDEIARLDVLDRARQLTAARMQASQWVRASGDIPRAA